MRVIPGKQAGDHFVWINDEVYSDFVKAVLMWVLFLQLQSRYEQGYISMATSQLRSIYFSPKNTQRKTLRRVDSRNEDVIDFRLVIINLPGCMD